MDLMDEFQARRLVHTYADMILRISYQYLKQTCDAEDICQTVFLKYITHNMAFDSVEHEKAWIIRTAVNACKDHVKSSYFRRTVALDDAAQIAAPAVPDTWLLDGMKTLSEKYRLIRCHSGHQPGGISDVPQGLGTGCQWEAHHSELLLHPYFCRLIFESRPPA